MKIRNRWLKYCSVADEGADLGGGGGATTTEPSANGDTPKEEPTALADTPPPEVKDEPESQEQPSGKVTESGAPEKYELALPEGMQLDEGLLSKAEPIFRELNLTNEQASKLSEFHYNAMKEATDNQLSSEGQRIEQQRNEWRTSLSTDKEFGGEKLNENLNVARSVIQKFGGENSEALVSALNETGVGNHPEIVRLFYRIGKAMSDDTVVNSGQHETKPKGKFYNNSPELKA